MSLLRLPPLKRFVRLLLMTLMLSLSTEHAFSLDAKHWQQLPDVAKRYYLLGSVEAWNELIPFASDLSEPAFDGMLNTVLPCIQREKLNPDHLVATVQKYLNHHPSDLGIEMSALVFTAVSHACTH